MFLVAEFTTVPEHTKVGVVPSNMKSFPCVRLGESLVFVISVRSKSMGPVTVSDSVCVEEVDAERKDREGATETRGPLDRGEVIEARSRSDSLKSMSSGSAARIAFGVNLDSRSLRFGSSSPPTKP